MTIKTSGDDIFWMGFQSVDGLARDMRAMDTERRRRIVKYRRLHFPTVQNGGFQSSTLRSQYCVLHPTSIEAKRYFSALVYYRYWVLIDSTCSPHDRGYKRTLLLRHLYYRLPSFPLLRALRMPPARAGSKAGYKLTIPGRPGWRHMNACSLILRSHWLTFLIASGILDYLVFLDWLVLSYIALC